jgi:predicted RNA-binding Zn-ribbon protein involved in translation (DUF1610 family)
MVSKEDTINVPADTYSNALPDDYDEETVEIGLTAFSDKLYLKFPRLDRRGTNDMCMSFGSIVKALIRVTDSGRASRSSSVDKQSESNRGGLEVEPILRRMNVLRKQDEDFVHGDDDDVTTTILGNRQENEPVHLKLVEAFCTTIGGFQDDEYWQGYKRAANKFGDERYEWKDVAWDVFSEEWNGDIDLMLELGEWFAREGWAVCSRTDALFPAPEWSTPTGSYVATISAVHGGKCPNCGADKSENWECIKSSNRTRVPNKYKCQECGTTRNGITTG